MTNNTGGAQDYFVRVYVFSGSTEDCNNYDLTVDLQGAPTGCSAAARMESMASRRSAGVRTKETPTA